MRSQMRNVIISVRTDPDRARLEATRKHIAPFIPESDLVSYEVERDNGFPVRGCAQSHASVAAESRRLFAESGLVTTVLESDSRPFGDHYEAWKNIILPFAVQSSRVDIVFGGISSGRYDPEVALKIPDSPYHLLKVSGGSGFFHYAPVSDRGYEAIENYAGPNAANKNAHIDVKVMSNRNVHCYVVVPYVGSTVNGFSVIRNRVANFENRVANMDRAAQRHLKLPRILATLAESAAQTTPKSGEL